MVRVPFRGNSSPCHHPSTSTSSRLLSPFLIERVEPRPLALILSGEGGDADHIGGGAGLAQ